MILSANKVVMIETKQKMSLLFTFLSTTKKTISYGSSQKFRILLHQNIYIIYMSYLVGHMQKKGLILLVIIGPKSWSQIACWIQYHQTRQLLLQETRRITTEFKDGKKQVSVQHRNKKNPTCFFKRGKVLRCPNPEFPPTLDVDFTQCDNFSNSL